MGFSGCTSDPSGNSSGNTSSPDTAPASNATTEAGSETTEVTGEKTESGGTPTESTSEETETDTATPEPTEEPTQNAQAFGPETFSGSATSTSDTLDLAAGPLTVSFSHEGSGNFIVELLIAEGESYNDKLLVNQIGQVSGEQVTMVLDAPYVLNVEANGPWEVTLEQPASVQPKPLPAEASGEGLSYVGPFAFDGLTEFTGTHQGEGNFIVTAVPLEPPEFSIGLGTLVFNKIGTFEGSKTVRIDGDAYVNIQADGAWSLRMQSK